ncbi:MAG: SIS domain-containing protein [Simkaniaceae bacterium]|nr:SIS domain-containing protein [Simkaniaceae bacterium]
MREAIQSAIQDGVRAIQGMLEDDVITFIEDVASVIATAYRDGKKVLVAGNGGSLCDAMHFAEELTGYFRHDRKALPAIAISDPSHISCVANDAGFETVFSRYVEALGQEGDILVVLTTSGNSENMIRAALSAQDKGMQTVAFLGKGGGKIAGMCDYQWIVDGFKYSDRIQEAHMTAIHIIIQMVEQKLFAEEVSLL